MKSLRLALVVACFAGCGSNQPTPQATMTDSFDQDIFGAHNGTLDSPYLIGSQFTINVTTVWGGPQTGWTIVSSDPSVIQVGTLYNGSSQVTAGGDGHATVSVLDESGATVVSQDVTVEVPDQVSLYAEGLLLTGAGDSASEVTSISVYSGGDALFLVRYFRDGNELLGSGALVTSTTGDVTTQTEQGADPNAPSRDFLDISTPDDLLTDTASVQLMLAKVLVSTVTVTTVSSVSKVDLVSQSTMAAKEGDELTVYAHAVDSAGNNVFGASYDWTVNGKSLDDYTTSGPTDLLVYHYKPSVTEKVGASLASFSPTTEVHGTGAMVESTGDQAAIACAVRAPGRNSSGLATFGAFIALAALAATRRRAHCKQSFLSDSLIS